MVGLFECVLWLNLETEVKLHKQAMKRVGQEVHRAVYFRFIVLYSSTQKRK